MTRLRIAAFAVLLLAAVLEAAPPAQAGTNACAGTGAMSTSQRFYYKGFGPYASGSMSFWLTGACAAGGGISAFASIEGWCDDAAGDGVITDVHGAVHPFNWSADQHVIEVSGVNVRGYGTWMPDLSGGQSCLAGATQFVLTLTLVFI